MIKSFKGQIADGGQETIRLGTIRGEIDIELRNTQLYHRTPLIQVMKV